VIAGKVVFLGNLDTEAPALVGETQVLGRVPAEPIVVAALMPALGLALGFADRP
jgi:hypothetical protein